MNDIVAKTWNTTAEFGDPGMRTFSSRLSFLQNDFSKLNWNEEYCKNSIEPAELPHDRVPDISLREEKI